MSVKRYAYGDFGMDVLQDGEFVLHTDYAAILARHNALVEAVAWLFDADDSTVVADSRWDDYAILEALATYESARAEVDRLIANETAADCKGEG